MGVDPVSLAINAALIAANAAVTASQQFEGPRLDDLKTTTADYGTPLNYLHGLRRFEGVSCIWAEPLREVKRRRKTKGGKYNDYTYYGTFAVAVCDQQTDAVTRIWFDRNLVYDTTGSGPISPFSDQGSITSYMRIYLGTETQLPDPRMQATIEAQLGAGFCPAYRGVTYIVFEDLPLEKIGNRLPQVSVEVVTNGGTTFPYETKTGFGGLAGIATLNYSSDYGLAVWSSPLDDEVEVWDVAARTRISTTTVSPALYDATKAIAIGQSGVIYGLNATGNAIVAWDHVSGAGSSVASLNFIGEGVRTILLDDGSEWVCATSQIAFPDSYAAQLYQTNGSGAVTEIATGGAAISGYLRTTYGDIYAIGHDYISFPLTATDRLILWKVWDNGGPTAASIELTGLPSSTSFWRAQAMHVDGHFVVAWAGTDLYRIDETTGAILQHRALTHSNQNKRRQFDTVSAGAGSIWLDPGTTASAMEISTADLSTIRSVSFASWFATGVPVPIYDPVNHALIGTKAYPDTDQVTWFYLDRTTSSGVLLSDIVDDVSARCGLLSGDWDASDLDQTVQGYSWTQGSGQAILEPLLEAYDSDVRPHDFTVEFLKRGVAGVGSIPRTELVGKPRFEITEAADGDLPATVSMTFSDPAVDGQPNTALARRNAASVDSKREQSLDLGTLTLDATTAKQMAESYLRRIWFNAETVKANLTRAYTAIEPGDAYTITLDDIDRTLKASRVQFGGDGVVSVDWFRYAPTVHTSTTALPGAAADGIVPSVMPVVGYSRGLVLDIPLVRDADEALITYLAASPFGATTGWPGVDFYSSDDGVTYSAGYGSVSPSEQAVIGTATTALPDALSTVIDYGSSVTVTVLDGTLTSCTELEMLNGSNRAILGDEVIGYTTATLTGTNTYDLTGLLRGRRGTEWATGSHVAGERFVVLGGLPKVTMGASEVGDTDYYQPITVGGSSGFVQTLAFAGVSKKPYAPAHFTATDNAGDIDLDWTRRTRIGGEAVYGTTPPLGETSEAYAVDILDVSDVVIRTLSGLTSPAATYTAAQQATDGGAGITAKVYQISSVVGRGYAATVAI